MAALIASMLLHLLYYVLYNYLMQVTQLENEKQRRREEGLIESEMGKFDPLGMIQVGSVSKG